MTTECPICGYDCRSTRHLRQHLHAGHREDEIVEAILDDRLPDHSRVEASDRQVVEAE